MEVASRLLAVAAPAVEPSRSVRSTGEQPLFVATQPDRLLEAATAHARAALERTGTLAVIAPAAMHAEIIDRLGDIDASTDATDALDAAVAVLEPAEAKGLEFDHVVVVEPARLVTADRAGLRLLYVTITRTTKTLTVVHAESLPEGLATRA
jgi:DNA helicase IV